MNNKQPSITLVFDRRKTATDTRKASVEIRVCYNYQQKYISTGVMLYAYQWKKGKIINCPDLLQISQTLDKMLVDIRTILYNMMNDKGIDINQLSDELYKRNDTIKTFVEFMEQRVSVWKYGKAPGTIKRYDCFTKLFYKWNKIVSFNDINDTNIIAFDKYLSDMKMCVSSKWGNYHKYMNTLISEAISDGYITRNPYKWLNIDRGKNTSGISKYLTPEEFRKLKVSKMPTECIERVRDVFVFQTYTCLSYSDLLEFDSRMVQEVKGVNVYVGSRIKTNMTFTIPLLSPALDILHKYNGKLPVISNVKYNEYLKIVAQAAGIDKPLTTHWARHTGATLLLNEGVPMQIVSKICGHSSTKITEQVYAKLLDETVVKAIQDLKI